MKILITFFPIDDLGGIINHHEQLCAGFKELGHEVTTKLLMWRDSAPSSVAGGKGPKGHAGLCFDQRAGFSWQRSDIIPYKGETNIAKWLEYASQFDLIIWQVAVPTKRKENVGNVDWIKLYDNGTKNIAVIHDGNFLHSYPWLMVLSKKLSGLACVHTCAYNSAAHIDCPSALIVNPFELCTPDLSRSAYMKRQKGFLSVQTFKAWKRVPEICRAVPHMGNIVKKLAGKGIDYYYLTSQEKCKYPGVWGAAVENGLDYMGVITNEQRDRVLREVTCLLDASWSHKYGSIGGHFNRVFVDAILQGALPVGRDLAVGRGQNERFVNGYNCLTIPWDYTPSEFGHMMTEYAHLEYEAYVKILEGGVYTVQEFDRKLVAERYIHLAEGRIQGQFGVRDPEVWNSAMLAVGGFFNA